MSTVTYPGLRDENENERVCLLVLSVTCSDLKDEFYFAVVRIVGNDAFVLCESTGILCCLLTGVLVWENTHIREGLYSIHEVIGGVL